MRGCSYPSIRSLHCRRGEGGAEWSLFCLKKYQRTERQYFTCKLSMGERRARRYDSANVSLLIGLCIGTSSLKVCVHGSSSRNLESG